MPADVADPVRFGPFYLEARIAVGGTAEVYLARPIDARAEPRRLVVKRLLPDLLADAEAVSMFEREARLHAAVHHPNVVEVFGSGSAEGEPYLAMEWIEGIDGFRLLRRIKTDKLELSPSVAVHAARELLSGLESVHSAKGEDGSPLNIVHRDISPSNVYFAKRGDVKLGDFGIARDATRPVRSQASVSLKGKYAYLAPEQVASEPSDARADLFSAAVVLSEMLLGEPLFSGAGQLAVLLAIRDCRIDPLVHARARLPPGLFEVLARALARNPDARYATAAELRAALAPFDPDPAAARAEIAKLVSLASRKESTDRMMAMRDSARIVAAKPIEEEPPRASERPTGEYSTKSTWVHTSDGRKLGPWTFAQLVEALATGIAGRGDRIDYMGTGLKKIEELPDLQRFMPPDTQITDVQGPKPIYTLDLAMVSILEPLLRVLENAETGALFATDAPGDTIPAFGKGAGRKELYFVKGRLHHVASSNASELLGEYLVRRGAIARDELDMALAVLPRNQGRMGDTLISLGLIEPMALFRAIREQGRDRVVDIFSWPQGRVAFYRGETPGHVEFPLDIDVAQLIVAGVEGQLPGETAMERIRPQLGARLVLGARDRVGLTHVRWPTTVAALMVAAKRGGTLADAIRDVAHGLRCTAADVARALEIVLAARLVALA